jgi:hypothetical protein
MRRNAALDAVTEELAAAGIDFQIEHGGRHRRVVFEIGGVRQFVIASFGGGGRNRNWRAEKNARADVRRILRTGKAR